MAAFFGLKVSRNGTLSRYATLVEAGVAQASKTGPRARRATKGFKRAELLRTQGKIPRKQAEPIDESTYKILAEIWRREISAFALRIIKFVHKDTRMTTHTLVPLGEAIGYPYYSGILAAARRRGPAPTQNSTPRNRPVRGAWYKPRLGGGTPEYSKDLIRGPALGRQFGGGPDVFVKLGTPKRIAFSFGWSYGAWQHFLMDLPASQRPGGAFGFPADGLRTVQSSLAELRSIIQERWTVNALNFAKYWMFNGGEAAEGEAEVFAKQRAAVDYTGAGKRNRSLSKKKRQEWEE